MADSVRRSMLMLPVSGAAATAMVRPVSAAPPDAAGQGAGPVEALGIGLEGWPYPHPVSFLPVTMQEQTLRMAFMDVPPLGAANGRSVILLHGKNFDGSYWAGPIEWLRRAGFRVLAPDQIGFNKLAKPDLVYSFDSLARNSMALANALSLGRVILIGLVDYRRFIATQSIETAGRGRARPGHGQLPRLHRAFLPRAAAVGIRAVCCLAHAHHPVR